MMLRLSLAALATLAFHRPALADKFHFGPADDAKKMQAGTPQIVEGVLLKEENGMLEIRVEGGTITLAKAMVTKIEKDGLTVADLEKREKDTRDKLALADRKRGEIQAAEASARRSEAPAEAAPQKELRIVVDFQGMLPNYTFKSSFDPVLDRVNLGGLAPLVETYLRDQVERAAGRK